jgi:membrane protein YdbS with pleckstrin-like domain
MVVGLMSAMHVGVARRGQFVLSSRCMQSDPNTQWFPSKNDGWLAAILAIAPLFSCVGFLDPKVFESTTVLLLALAGPAVFAAIYGLLVFPMRYGISADELIIRHGVVRQRAALAKILSVEPTRNPLSSPALSLDRLKISTGPRARDSIMISPADREGFLTLLAQRSGLVRQGETLVRR